MPLNPRPRPHEIKVMIGIPNGGDVKAELMRSVFRMINASELPILLNAKTDKPVDNCRNKIILDFLGTDCTHLLFIDSDNPPIFAGEQGCPLRLPIEHPEHAESIIACPTPMMHGKPYQGQPPTIFNVFTWTGTGYRPWNGDRSEGLVEVDACGTGCMLIHRQVLEHSEMRPWFSRQWDANGVAVMGSDLRFCAKAKKNGFAVFAHWGYPCRHIKESDLFDMWRVVHDRDPNNCPSENPNTPEYWDSQWPIRQRAMKPYFGPVIGLLASREPESVLDIGCGNGELVEAIRAEGINAVGADQSEAAILGCEVNGIPAYPMNDIWEAGRTFDVITCTEVLEHLDDDVGTADHWLELADEMIFTVPNNRLPPGFEPEHRRLYTANSIKRRFPRVKSVEDIGGYLMGVMA